MDEHLVVKGSNGDNALRVNGLKYGDQIRGLRFYLYWEQ